MMKINRLRTRVQRAELIVIRHGQQTHSQWKTIGEEWKACWTAPRIIFVGFGLGFLSAITRPHAALGKISGQINMAQRLVELLSTFSAIARTFGFGSPD